MTMPSPHLEERLHPTGVTIEVRSVEINRGKGFRHPKRPRAVHESVDVRPGSSKRTDNMSIQEKSASARKTAATTATREERTAKPLQSRAATAPQIPSVFKPNTSAERRSSGGSELCERCCNASRDKLQARLNPSDPVAHCIFSPHTVAVQKHSKIDCPDATGAQGGKQR